MPHSPLSLHSCSPLTRFHLRQAVHGLYQFAESLKSSLEVILLAAGQVVLMALALLSWPVWLIAMRLADGWPIGYGLLGLASYAALLSLPIFLLRKRLLPEDTARWLRALPVAPRARRRAHLAVAALFIGPLAIGFAASSVACWFELPGSHRVPGLALLLMALSLLLVLGFGTGILTLRQRALARRGRRAALSQPSAQAAAPYRPQRPPNRLLQQWHQLFWLPFWRLENGIGLQQCLLFGASLLLFGLWLQPAPAFVRFLFGVGAGSMVLILTDQGAKAVQEQMTRILPHLRALPVAMWPLAWLARLFCLLPALLVLGGFALVLAGGVPLLGRPAFHAGVAYWYLGVQVVGQIGLVAMAEVSAAARARLVILLMVLLSAIGSELWR